jgi:ATP synthase I subunit
MTSEFVRRVSVAMLVALGPLAACAALLAGWPGAVGVLAGGLVSLGSFRWIADGVARAAAPGAHGRLGVSALAVGARHLALFGALAAVLWSGAAHPLALFAGLSVLPPLLIAFGLVDTGSVA